MKTPEELIDALESAVSARQRARMRCDDDAQLVAEVRACDAARGELVAALTQPAAPQGVAYAELEKLAELLANANCGPKEKNWSYLGVTAREEWINVARVAMAASHGQAPAGATPWRSAVLDLIDECPGLTMEQDHWLSRRVKELEFASAPRPTAQAAPAAGAVAYLDISVGGYLDLGTDLSDEALSCLPKGRHALVIAGTYGIDGYTTAAPTPADQADSKPMLRDWVTSDDPVQALDAIMAVYEKCMGTTPGPEMAHVVSKTKEMLFDWWGRYRELAREALIKADSVLEDAARWQALPAFFEEYQIDAMKIYRDIDAYLAAARMQGENS